MCVLGLEVIYPLTAALTSWQNLVQMTTDAMLADIATYAVGFGPWYEPPLSHRLQVMQEFTFLITIGMRARWPCNCHKVHTSHTPPSPPLLVNYCIKCTLIILWAGSLHVLQMQCSASLLRHVHPNSGMCRIGHFLCFAIEWPAEQSLSKG
jgi:hypothetical protein